MLKNAPAEKYKFKWIILALCFWSNFLTWGVCYSVGVLYAEWVNFFQVPMFHIGFAGSLPTAIACLFGPIYGVIVTKFGIRKSAVLGGIIMSLGIVITFFATNIWKLCLFFGGFGGFGAGLTGMACCGIINCYFVRNRSLAESVLGGGLSAGVFLISPLLALLSHHYTWQGAMLILGGICLHNVVLGLLFIGPEKLQNYPHLQRWKTSTNNSKNIKLKYSKPDHNHNVKKYDVGPCTEILPNLEVDDLKTKTSFKNEEPTLTFYKRSLKLWKDSTFLILLVADFLSLICLFVPYVHLVARARIGGIDQYTSSWIAASIGLSGFIGRPLTGAVINYFKIHPLLGFLIFQMLCGLTTFLSPLWNTAAGLFTFAILFGTFGNSYGLMKASAAALLGTKRFIDAFSWMLLFEGIGVMLGPPLAGFLYDVTQSYIWPFRISGCGLFISGFICVFKVPSVEV